MPKWLDSVIGGLEIAAGAFMVAGALPGGALLGWNLIGAGISTEVAGIGQLLSKSPLSGATTATKNPIAPWNVIYGRVCHGGTPIFINSFGQNDKWLDMVFAAACHPCEGIYGLLFDRQPVQIDTTAVAPGVPASAYPIINGGTSFTPVQQTVNIAAISRNNDVVTVTLVADIPLLQAGNSIIIQNVTGDETLNGKFPVAQILEQVYEPGTPGTVTFTYLCGGPEVSYSSQGQCKTTWQDYGRKIYIEVLNGTQTLGETFHGMLNGTPYDGDTSNLVGNGTGGADNSLNPWNRYCSGVGKTLVWLRLHYNDGYFANGLPQISFLIQGKNNIKDPRFSPAQVGYTENAALCTADMMSDPTWGFKCDFTNDINQAQLIQAANICDEQVELGAPVTSPPTTENRYRCNGMFDLRQKRGEILQNMLTACAGRITYSNAQYFLWPGKWYPTIVTSAPGYTGQAVINQNCNKVVDGPQANFRMLISGTYPQLKSVANGGQVQNANGYDITFSSDNLAANLLPWEIEYWNPVTGQIIAWVCVSLSNLSDTQFFMNYGNPSIASFQGGSLASVWGPDYNVVLHLENGSALSGADSSGNGNNATAAGGASATTGIIDGAAHFDGSSGALAVPNQMSPDAGSIEAWIHWDPQGGGALYIALGSFAAAGAPEIFAYGLGIHFIGWQFGTGPVRDTGISWESGFQPGTDWWNLVCITWDSAANIVQLLINGVVVDSMPYDPTAFFPSPYYVGGKTGTSNFWPGTVDEVRISSTARTPGWESTRYNNETSPSTFYSISFNTAMAVNSVTPWGPLKWTPYLSGRDLFNAVRGTYIAQANNWQPSDFPPYAQDDIHGYHSGSPEYPSGDANLAFDGGDRRYLNIRLPFTLSSSTAQRIAKIILMRIRQQGSGTLTLNMAGYQQTAIDIVTCTFSFLSWVSKTFEIQKHRLLFMKKRQGSVTVVSLGVSIDVQESDPSIYDWNPATEDLTPQGYPQASLPVVTGPAEPANVLMVVGPGASINEFGGVGQCTILVSWTAPADGFVTNGGRIDAQYQLESSPPGPWIALPSVAPSVTSLIVPNVQAGQSYSVQIRAVNAAGVPSAWVNALTNGSPPSPVITITGVMTQLYLVNGT